MARKTVGGPRAPFSASSASASNSKSKQKPSRANRASKNDPANAYTYEPSLPKRHRLSEQQNSLSRDEAKAGPSSPRRKSKPLKGGDDEEEEDDEEESMEERIRKLQMMIASDAPGQVDEDSEESEVDSDQAWESDGSDEERWGDVFRDLSKGKSKAKVAKGKEVVLKVCPRCVWARIVLMRIASKAHDCRSQRNRR
jgi:U3 small nucleolar RNA-associated protein 14